MANWEYCPAVERVPGKVSGAWVFKDTRLPLYALFENFASGATIDDFVEWFGGVEKWQVEAVLEHAADELRDDLVDYRGYPMINRAANKADLVAQVAPSVLHILAVDADGEGLSIGSGFVINPHGFAITNAHVAEDNSDVSVYRVGGEYCTADVLHTNDSVDLAIIKLASQELIPAMPMGNSTKARTGDDVIAFGFPRVSDDEEPGENLTVTSGIVSGKHRRSGVDHIHTDAAFNPASSGGPLINLRGQVIGVNQGGKPDMDNMAWAIAINEVKKWLASIPNWHK